MFSRCLSLFVLLPILLMGGERRVLRVCADPNNLPFSNQAGEGIENRVASLVAKDLNASVEYTWWPQRRGFLKNSLGANLCDVIMGVPSTLDSALPTRPYYHSTYVFVTRRDRALNISSLEDPRLAQMRIGIHMAGNDYTPPAHLLAHRGLAKQLIGYRLYGASDEADSPSHLVEAVAKGEVDVAIVWGPFAGYFAKGQKTALLITPVSPKEFSGIPFTYGISATVRKGEDTLRAEIDSALQRECKVIAALLTEYGIPGVPEDQPQCDSSLPAVSYSR
jgi:mxaJ protein